MSVEGDGRAAARATFPDNSMSRVPYAQGYQAGIQAALASLPDLLESVMCATCGGDGSFIQSPTGSWWAHNLHPRDHHDYVPTVRA